MPMTILDAGNVERTIIKCRVLDGGTLRNILRMKVLDADNTTLRTVATFSPPMSLSVSPPSLYAESIFDTVLTTAAATATPTGGLGPYTYAWTILSGDATVNFPTSAVTQFTSGELTPNVPSSATARCTCTDAGGQTATADVELGFLLFHSEI